jgi:hypothetical protein
VRLVGPQQVGIREPVGELVRQLAWGSGG